MPCVRYSRQVATWPRGGNHVLVAQPLPGDEAVIRAADAPLAPRPMRELVRSVAAPAGQTALGLVFAVLLLGYAVKLYRAFAPRYPRTTRTCGANRRGPSDARYDGRL